MFFAYFQVDCHTEGKCWGSSWNLPGWMHHKNQQKGGEIESFMHAVQQKHASPHPQPTPVCINFKALHNPPASFCHVRPERESTHKALKQNPSITAREQGSGKNRRGWNSSLQPSPSTSPASEMFLYSQDAFSQSPIWNSHVLKKGKNCTPPLLPLLNIFQALHSPQAQHKNTGVLSRQSKQNTSKCSGPWAPSPFTGEG